ncbi:MAG: energy-coupling factor transporter transmembrane component T [Candidatus Omnitrophota bacterium]
MRPFCHKSKRPSICEFHPLSAAIYAAVLFLFTLYFRHPLYLLVFLAVIVFGVFWAGDYKTLKNYFIFAFWMILPIIFINAFFCSAGQTVLLRGPDLPVIGKIVITQESLFYGLDMGLKILLSVGVFCFYQAISDIDGIFSFGLKIAPKPALVLIMAFSLLPRLKKDLGEIKDAMTVRGVDFGAGSFAHRIKKYFPLWKVLLLNYLEGCWNTAQSLYVRAFDTGKRSFYSKIKWRLRDYLLTGGCLFSLTGFVLSLNARQEFKFYPVMDGLFYGKDLFFMTWLFLGMSVIFFCRRGKEYGNF